MDFLLSCFPEIPTEDLSLVLHSFNGSVDKAIDYLVTEASDEAKETSDSQEIIDTKETRSIQQIQGIKDLRRVKEIQGNNTKEHSKLEKNTEDYYVIQKTWASNPIYIKIQKDSWKSPTMDIPLYSKAHLTEITKPFELPNIPKTFTEDAVELNLIPYLLPYLYSKESDKSNIIAMLHSEQRSITELREQANLYNQERGELFRKANEYYSKGKLFERRATAGYYAQEGHELTKKMEECNNIAACLVLLKNHPNGTLYKLDLHGLLVREALKILFPAIQIWFSLQTTGTVHLFENKAIEDKYKKTMDSRTFGNFIHEDEETSLKVSTESKIQEPGAFSFKELKTVSTHIGMIQPLTIITGQGFHSVKAGKIKPQLMNALLCNNKWQYKVADAFIVISGPK